MKTAVAVLLFALPAFAATPVWVVARDVKLLKDAKPTAASVATLKFGEELVFLERSAKDKKFAEVTAGGKRGFVAFAALSALKPQTEVPGGRGFFAPPPRWVDCARGENLKWRPR